MKTIDGRFMRAVIKSGSEQDEEVWRTSEEGHHFKLESETGEIKAGFGGKLNGQKVDPSKKRSSSAGMSATGPAEKSVSSTSREQKNNLEEELKRADEEHWNHINKLRWQFGSPKLLSGHRLKENATQVMGNKTTPEAVNKGINSVVAQIRNARPGQTFHCSRIMKGYNSTDDFTREKDGTWTRLFFENGQEKFTKKGLSDKEVGERIVANAMNLSEDEFNSRYKSSAKPAAKSKSNYIIKADGPYYKNAELEKASQGKKFMDESDLDNVKAGSNRRFTVIEPVVNSPQGNSPGLYSKRDPYGYRVITGAKMVKGNTPGSQYVFEDNDGNKITFGSMYGDSVDVYEE